jgi:hypothetical protein
MNVSVVVGVLENSCDKAVSVSYPFVLAVFDTTNNFEPYGGFDLANFPDGCKAPKAGTPTK